METFLFNYNYYLKICDEEPHLFSPNEKRILDNQQIKEAASHMLQQLNVVTQSLNVMQSDSSNLCDALDCWLSLSSSPILSDKLKSKIEERMKKAITLYHTLAKMVSTKISCELPINLKEKAISFAEELDSSFPGILAALEVEDDSVFPRCAFNDSIRNILEPIKYWRYIENNTSLEPLKRFCRFAMKLLSCPPSSAG